MYNIGDKVRVTNLRQSRNWNVTVGDVFKVAKVDSDGDVYIKTIGSGNRLLTKSEIEKVEESKKMTFPEMVQKLIDGEFEVGTELVMTDEDGLKVTFYVRENIYGYGISKEADWFVENKATFPSVLNGIWTVKENDIKEMSIEELQKELGYKVKIVERSAN